MLGTQTILQPDMGVTNLAIIELRRLFKSYHTPAGAMPALRGLI
jgi:hypothetical protein